MRLKQHQVGQRLLAASLDSRPIFSGKTNINRISNAINQLAGIEIDYIITQAQEVGHVDINY